MSDGEFTAIIISEGGTRPVMSKPRMFRATKKFIAHVQDNLDIPDDRAIEASDWVLNLMERYGANSAQPVFTMDGNGPICSWCGMIWPLCGHHHMSSNLGPDEEEEEEESAA